MLRRTGKSNYVFPGGVLEKSDSTMRSLFTPKEFKSLTPNGVRAPIFTPEGRDFALRVAGIRETFEE